MACGRIIVSWFMLAAAIPCQPFSGFAFLSLRTSLYAQRVERPSNWICGLRAQERLTCQRRELLLASFAGAASLIVSRRPAHAIEGDLPVESKVQTSAFQGLGSSGSAGVREYAIPPEITLGGPLEGCPIGNETAKAPLPRCYSSAASPDDVQHYIQPFQFNKSRQEAMDDLVQGAKAYSEVQDSIDSGGWKIIKQTYNYLYLQYGSAKPNQIADLEFYIEPGEKLVNVRSASRAGTVSGVNAKRVNWFVSFLVGKGGWNATRITKARQPIYVDQHLD